MVKRVRKHPNILRRRCGHESIVHIYVSTRALLVYARTRVWLWYIIEYEVAGRVGMLIPWLSPAAAGSPIRLSVCMFVRHRVRLFRTDSNDSSGSHQFVSLMQIAIAHYLVSVKMVALLFKNMKYFSYSSCLNSNDRIFRVLSTMFSFSSLLNSSTRRDVFSRKSRYHCFRDFFCKFCAGIKTKEQVVQRSEYRNLI